MTNDIQESIKDRLSSPILGTFTLTYLISNYKVFIYAFSSLPPEDKIKEIDNILICYWQFAHLGITLAITLFILFIIPNLKNRYEIHLAESSTEKAKKLDILNRDRLVNQLSAYTAIGRIGRTNNLLTQNQRQLNNLQIMVKELNIPNKIHLDKLIFEVSEANRTALELSDKLNNELTPYFNKRVHEIDAETKGT